MTDRDTKLLRVSLRMKVPSKVQYVRRYKNHNIEMRRKIFAFLEILLRVISAIFKITEKLLMKGKFYNA